VRRPRASDERPMSKTKEQTERFVQQLTGCQTRLYAYILMLLPNHDNAADVLQETNLVLWRKADEFVDGTEFGAWACRIAHFQVLAWLRDAQRDRHVFDPELLGSLPARPKPLAVRWTTAAARCGCA